ncbi:MAG: hypothetical protein ABIG84_03020 [archaeon]
MKAMLNNLAIEHPSSNVVIDTRYNSMLDFTAEATVVITVPYDTPDASTLSYGAPTRLIISKIGAIEFDTTEMRGIANSNMRISEKMPVVIYISMTAKRFLLT